MFVNSSCEGAFRRKRPIGKIVACGLWFLISGCSEGHRSKPITIAAPPGMVVVDVPAATVTTGFDIGHLRAVESIGAFAITKHPITRDQYSRCVSAGLCGVPSEEGCTALRGGRPLERPNYEGGDEITEASPITCAGVENARRYCKWAGGTLPNLVQWMLAARGEGPRRYSWGDERPTCEQHPGALTSDYRLCEREDSFGTVVGHHPAGASPLGVEDVLLTRAELAAVSEGSPGACKATPDRSTGACLVHGMENGAIDFARRFDAKQKGGGALPYGFRCVWSAEVAQ
jgi:hypothetical protein